MKRNILFSTILFLFVPHLNAQAQILWGMDNSRTDNRDDAGLQGTESGFFQTYNPINFPPGATGWWHLLDVRHSNPAVNVTMQFAGASFDQYLYFRKTNYSPSTPWSRVILETDGKVGIGTLNPITELEVRGNLTVSKLIGGLAANFSNYTDLDLQFTLTTPGVSDKYALIAPSTPLSNLAFGTAGQEMVRLTSTGNFGIGTPSPQSKLDVVGSGNYDINLKVNGRIQTGDANHQGGIWLDAAKSQFLGQYGASTMGFFTNNQWRMVVDDNGNVGIGTTAPKAKLAVMGDIFAQKLKVTLENWPDYVFDLDYKLLPLDKLETYINKNKHLPDVPTEEEIKKGGLDVGENQALLLKKVEELTLYLIEHNGNLEQMAEQIKIQQKDLNLLRSMVKLRTRR